MVPAAALVLCSLIMPVTAFGGVALRRGIRRAPLLMAAGEDDPDTAQARGESNVDFAYLKAAKETKPAPGQGRVPAAAFSLYAIGFTVLLTRTLMSFPLIPPSPNSLAWCRSWLITTVVDYYGAALALCGIIVASETNRVVGIAWSAGCLFLGTPFCCLYVATRLLRHGTLRLVASD